MAEAKKVSIFLSRKITLERKNMGAVTMTSGHNIVDADVAEHPFVKAHLVEGASVEAASDLVLKVEALTAENEELRATLAAYEATSKKAPKK